MTHESVDLETETVVKKKKTGYVGICWGLEQNPDLEGDHILDVYISETSSYSDDYFFIEDLNPNSTYYFRSVFKDMVNNEVYYSDEYTLTTLSLPEPPCETSFQTVDFGAFTQSTSSLEVASIEDYPGDGFAYVSTCDLGKFRLMFAEEPTTGIYRTVSFEDHDTNSEICVDFRGGAFNCYYNSGLNKEVYVEIDNTDGSIRIRFCDIGIVTASGCTSSYTLSAEFNN